RHLALDRQPAVDPGHDAAVEVVGLPAGAAGGTWERGGESGRYEATPLRGEVRDAYGCGDSFAAGLTFGLGAELPLDSALELAARCGAACLTGRGPYAGQLSGAPPRPR
ncbi:MAG TPA: PfkB family carbohydrate kinase, partial [Thermoleophilaceae bacterium]